MRFASTLVAGCAALLAAAPLAAAERVLFIGNSFTFGAGSPVRFYRNDTVTDLNNEGVGGVPALFKSFADQTGLDYDVALETRGGTGLDFHLAEKRDVIARHRWDIVVAHGYSTLDQDAPRDPAKLIATSRELAALLRTRNPEVDLYLMATWSRADQVYPAEGAWAGRPIEAMANDIRAAYDRAAADAGARVIPVGNAWNRAMQTGVADANPYDGIDAGKLDLWTYDHYHASAHGYYLEALVIFGRLTGRDPRSLGELECSAFELGLSRAQASALQQVAFDELAAYPAVAHNTPPPPAQGNLQRCDAR
jgi:hypothetical protein